MQVVIGHRAGDNARNFSVGRGKHTWMTLASVLVSIQIERIFPGNLPDRLDDRQAFQSTWVDEIKVGFRFFHCF